MTLVFYQYYFQEAALNDIQPSSPRSHGFSVQTADRLRPPSDIRALITSDHEVIRRWAARHTAEPATGEATVSGPGTIRLNDGGAGIRFNFPGAAPFRPISWDEWFENFETHQLAFAFEEEVQDRAYESWQARGAGHGHDRDDWFEAEQQLGRFAGGPSARYRLIKREIDEPDVIRGVVERNDVTRLRQRRQGVRYQS